MSLFVTFEGPEGAGKSTQVRLVADCLRDAGIDVLETREPGGSSLGERVRELLLSANDYAMAPETEALLMTAARAQHVAEVIRPALANGQVVLCDRFTDSTLAYQGAGQGLSEEALDDLQSFAVDSIRPDLTVLLDLPVRVGLSRREQSGVPLNRLDQYEVGFHERVRDWYVQAATEDPQRWMVVDAQQPPETTASSIYQCILTRLRRVSGVSGGDEDGE